jgi:hypothetical protein
LKLKGYISIDRKSVSEKDFREEDESVCPPNPTRLELEGVVHTPVLSHYYGDLCLLYAAGFPMKTLSRTPFRRNNFEFGL